MSKDTAQQEFWKGTFGNDYSDRISEDLDTMHERIWGVKRSVLNDEFLSHLPKDIRILEAGCNRGLQIQTLKKSGFTNLWGLEINKYALKLAREQKDMNLVEGSIFDLPFKDGFFDLTFTSGVLIHIAPEDLPAAMDELYRTSKKYIWGFEYFAEECTAIEYRGHNDRLWKNNFVKLFLDRFPDLKLIKKKLVPYVKGDNLDIMYLFEKP